MKNIVYILLAAFLFIPLVTKSQQVEMDRRQLFSQAEQAYKTGQIDNAIDLLNNNIMSYNGALKVSAFRLLSLCYLAIDDFAMAEKYVDQLLKEDPYYSISLNDPERFAEMIRNKKEGKTTLVTASQQVETLEEAPVPVTLITEEMIKAIGARDLRDVLAAYVPGITIVEGLNQSNISMHGVYSATQEKMLIMLNGHRLNSRSTNAEAPDFRNSLDKIKQIEVLRGPASSLYGNVALTAVVNIITKSGSDVNGLYSSYGMGDNSTVKGDVLFGKRSLDTDVLFWASIYSSAGEKRSITSTDDDFIGIIPIDGSVYIDGFNHKPAYDLGFILKWQKLKFMVNQQYSKKVNPYTTAALNHTIYDYDKYRLYNGIKPGNGRLSTRGELSYSDNKDNFSWNASVFFDAEEHVNYDVTGDTLIEYDSYLPLVGLEDEYHGDSFLIQNTGVYQILDWHDYSLGGNLAGTYSYDLGDRMKGNILAGVQVESYKMYYNSFLLGDQFDRVDITYSDRNRRIELGTELNLSGYMQLKHYFSKKLIFNGGFRYDNKHRFNSKVLRAFSPRLSLVYTINDIWNMKAGYSRSFVDAPFFYRANKTNAYRGGENLYAEYMNAVQLSTTVSIVPLHLHYDCNVYYNKLSDLVFYDPNQRMYTNAGKLNLMGVENVLSFSHQSVRAHWNMTYQRVLKAENYPVSEHRIYDIPPFTTNLSVMGKILSPKPGHALWLRGNASLYSRQISPIGPIYKGPENLADIPDNEVGSRVVVNIGAVYNVKSLEFSVQCYNLFNTDYKQGGAHLIYDVPQQGRSFLARLSYIIQ